jgi:hypothetical protein
MPRRVEQLEPIEQGGGVMEPSLSFQAICRLRSISLRAGQRERAAGAWPAPAYYVGTGARQQQPRWRADVIRVWLERGDKAVSRAR